MIEAPEVKLIFCEPANRIPCPDSRFTKPKKKAKEATATRTTAPQLGAVPESTIAKLKSLRDPDRKRMFTAIFEGESFAEVGERDSALQRVCSSLCWADEGATSIEGLAELLRPSLQAWACEEDADKDVEEELEKAIEKLTRASEEFSTFKDKQLASLEGLRKSLAPNAKVSFHHLLLQQDNTYYAYGFKEKKYWPSCTSRELLVVLRDSWPEKDSPTKLSYLNEKGQAKKKTAAQIMDEYGTVVREVVYSLAKTESVYSPDTKVLKVPSAPRRPLKPVHHPEIEQWLSLMPKYKRHLPMLLDWISTVSMLDRMSAALYLSGPKGTGKSLLTSGLARLWAGGGASKLEHVFSRFNGTMLNNPLIVLDESWKGDKNVNLCAQLRELVGNMSHKIEPKGKPVVTAEGSVRVIITTNNETTLNVKGNGDQNQMEREATVERILHIPTSTKASKYIVQIRNRDDWREKNMIAEHALWLRDQRAAGVIERSLSEGHRFLIQGDDSDAEFYDGIGSRPKDHDAGLQWLSCLFTRAIIPSIRSKVLIEPGKFRVVPRALCETWESYGMAKNFETPTSSHRAKAILKPFIESDDRVRLNGINAYKINIDRFVRIATEEGMIPPEVLKERLGL